MNQHHREERAQALRVMIILAVGLGVRLVGLANPLVGLHAWRQTDTSGIARNFARHGMNLLRPEVDWGGSASAVVESELPVYSYTLGLLYRLIGEYEGLGRLLSAGCSTLTGLLVYLLVRRRSDETTGLLAAAIFLFLPTSIFYGRAVMPDSLMLLASVLALWGIARWVDTSARWSIHLAWLGLVVAAGIKPHMLVLGLPLVGLLRERTGWHFLRDWRWWGFALSAFAALAAWFLHAHGLGAESGRSFGIWGAGTDKWANWSMIGTRAFAERVLVDWVLFGHLTIVGGTLLIGGLVWPPKGERERVLDLWFLALGLQVLVVGRGNYIHEYYSLPILLPAAWTMARPCAALLQRGDGHGRLLAGSALIFLAILSWSSWEERLTLEQAEISPRYQLGRALGDLAGPAQAIVVIDPFPSPETLYHADRKGWVVAPEGLSSDWLEQRRREGAAYAGFAVASLQPGQLEALKAVFAKDAPTQHTESGLVLVRLTEGSDR